MIYTCYEMVRDCHADRPEGWAYFISNYVPLIRKIRTLGTRVMVLGWNFEFTDDQGAERKTTTSPGLLEEAAYPILMNEVIGQESQQDDPPGLGSVRHCLSR